MRWPGLSLLIAAVAAQAAEPSPVPLVYLKIRPQACVHGRTATVADMVAFVEADSALRASLAEQPVLSDLKPGITVTVDHARIERHLRELGVNLAYVLLTGAAVCEVTALPAPEQQATGPAPGSAAAAESARAPGAKTLAEALRAYVTQELSGLNGAIELEFERAGEPFLGLTDPPWSFDINARGRERLGLREFRVVLSRDGRAHRTLHLTARVRLTKPVLVAQQPLNVGTCVRRDDLALESRLFEREADIGLSEFSQAIGQRVRRFVPAGQMIRAEDLRSEDLVRRSRPVTVIGTAPSLHVRVAAVALDSGGYGETVRVRIGDTRKDHRVLRGVVAGVGTVRVEEEEQL